MKFAWGLQAHVVNLYQRVAKAAAPALTPVAVVETHHTQHGQVRSSYPRSCVADIHHRRDIRRRVIHVFLNAVPVDNLHPEGVFLADAHVRARAHAPAPEMAAKVERRAAGEVIPGDVAAYA